MPSWKKVIVSGSDAFLNALTVTNGITGSLHGTASWAQNSITSSFVTGSNVFGPFGSNSVISASYAIFAETASYASNGGVTQLLAGPNIILSPISGKGQVTISSTGTGSGNFNTSTGSYGSFYDTTTQLNPVANAANSMSFNETAITNGVSLSGSTSPFNTYIKTENAGVYNIQFSAQIDKTDGGEDNINIWIRKNGTDLIDTATSLTLPKNNNRLVAAWNWFVQSATNDYYQIIWSSADIDMRLLAEVSSSTTPGIPSVILTANRIDQFLSNTGSFNGSFTGGFTGSLQGTASFANNATSASFATTASYVLNAVSSSFATSSSFSQNAVSASYAVTASILRNDTAKVSASSAIYTSGSSLLYDLSEFKGAMIDYVVSTSGSGDSIRGGTFTAVWNAVSSSSNEVTTMDIGNTDAVHFSADTTGSIFVSVTTGSWVVDSLYRALGTFVAAPFPSPTPTVTPSPITPTPTPTPSSTPIPPSQTPSLTPTPSPTPSPAITIFTHGTVLATCSDYCNSNYTISTVTVADNDYTNLTIGDTIYGQSGAGFVAYSNVSTDTTTGPFKVAEIDGSGVVTGITECSGGSCVPV